MCPEKKPSSQSNLFQHNKKVFPKVFKTEYYRDGLQTKIYLKFSLIVDGQQSFQRTNSNFYISQ